MSSSPTVKMKWLEHLNASWVSENSEVLTTREGVAGLYERLVTNQEVVNLPQPPLHVKPPLLPDFERDLPTQEEQEHYLNALLSSQLALARTVCSDSPYAAVLQKRLVVLQRIFHALATKYHDREKARQQVQLEENNAVSDEAINSSERARTGTEALIEMGIQTGLSLLFSLLKQNWHSNPSNSVLCNDVLQTALDVICSLPPLSLANEGKLPALGLSTLGQVTKFLKVNFLNTYFALITNMLNIEIKIITANFFLQ